MPDARADRPPADRPRAGRPPADRPGDAHVPHGRAAAAAVAVAALEGLVLAAYGVFLAVEGLRGQAAGPADVSSPVGTAVEVAVYLLFGAGLLAVARGLRRGQTWARTPLLLAQVFALVVGVPLVQAGQTPVRAAGAAVVLAAVVGIAAWVGSGAARR